MFSFPTLIARLASFLCSSWITSLLPIRNKLVLEGFNSSFYIYIFFSFGAMPVQFLALLAVTSHILIRLARSLLVLFSQRKTGEETVLTSLSFLIWYSKYKFNSTYQTLSANQGLSLIMQNHKCSISITTCVSGGFIVSR